MGKGQQFPMPSHPIHRNQRIHTKPSVMDMGQRTNPGGDIEKDVSVPIEFPVPFVEETKAGSMHA
jgi:hypothetical protein